MDRYRDAAAVSASASSITYRPVLDHVMQPRTIVGVTDIHPGRSNRIEAFRTLMLVES